EVWRAPSETRDRAIAGAADVEPDRDGTGTRRRLDPRRLRRRTEEPVLRARSRRPSRARYGAAGGHFSHDSGPDGRDRRHGRADAYANGKEIAENLVDVERCVERGRPFGSPVSFLYKSYYERSGAPGQRSGYRSVQARY